MLLLIRIDGYLQNNKPFVATNSDRLQEYTLRRVGNCLRRGDTLASISDGLFAILLEEIRDASAVPMAIEKIHAALSHPLRVDAQSVTVRYCTGASLFPMDGFLCSQLWLQAKLALDTATENGHGTFSFSPRMSGHKAIEGPALSHDLCLAAQSDQLQLVYQPVFNATGQQVISIEALVRWRHPEQGLLEPAMFMSVLEDTGMIISVGERLIQQACHLAAKLQQQGHSFIRVLINISARQFADSGFLLTILDALYETDVSPALIELEIAEDTLLKNIKRSQRILTELQGVGVRVTVDRFGEGESSLTEIIRLPLNGLKVGLALVNGLPQDKHNAAVTAGVFAMAHAAGIRTAANGVETGEQLAYLVEKGCDQVQGFYFSRPMQAAELGYWLPN